MQSGRGSGLWGLDGCRLMKPDAPDASGSPRGPHSHGRGLATVREALAGSRNDDLRIWLEMSLQVQRRQVLHLLEQHHEGVLAELSNKLGAPWQSGDEDSLKKMQPSSDPVLMAELDSLVTLSSATATGTAVEDSREKLPIGLDKDMHRLSISTAGTGAESVAVSRRWSRKTTTTAHLINEEDSVKPLSFQQPSTWVRHPLFESFFCLLIVGNTLVMALEIQYIGLQQGYELRYPKFTQPAEEVWPRAFEIFHSLENVFGAMFTVELLCRIMAFGREFLYDSWSWFDLAIVLAWLADLIVQGIIPPLGRKFIEDFGLDTWPGAGYIYRLFATGTIDEKVYQRQICKDGLSTMMVTETGEDEAQMTESLASDVVKDLFTFSENTTCATHDMLNCQRCGRARSIPQEGLGTLFCLGCVSFVMGCHIEYTTLATIDAHEEERAEQERRREATKPRPEPSQPGEASRPSSGQDQPATASKAKASVGPAVAKPPGTPASEASAAGRSTGKAAGKSPPTEASAAPEEPPVKRLKRAAKAPEGEGLRGNIVELSSGGGNICTMFLESFTEME
eukprot:s51_g8.t1